MEPRSTDSSTPKEASAPAGTSIPVSTQPIATPQTNATPESIHDTVSPRKAKPWNLSNEGIRFIAVCESGVLNGTYMKMPVMDGMILEVYNDSKGNPTVGLGHLVVPSDQLKPGDIITVERARELAKKNLSESESAINRRINVPLNQFEYDALVSISFNAGPAGGIAHLVDKVNEGDYAALPAYIRTYRARGIEWRRSLEARLFETANYDARHDATHKGSKKTHHRRNK
jgi:lysozyme